jgi:hypothetical protein
MVCVFERCTTPAAGDAQNVDDSPGDAGMPAGGTIALPVGGTYGKAGSGTGGAAHGGTGGVSRGGAAGVGGAAGAGGSAGGPSICDGKTYALPVSEGYIDDFETNERFAGWYAFSDTTPPNLPKPARVSVGAVLTAHSGYFTASNIKGAKQMGYGAGFGCGLVDPSKGACVDVSEFDGLSFWARGSVPDSGLKLQIVAHESQPADSQPVGDCPSTSSACAFRHPAKVLTVTTQWTHYVIRFADLKSSAFTWTDRRILGMNFITDGPSYTTWIDEVTFFKGPAPVGPVRDDGAAGAAGVSGL